MRLPASRSATVFASAAFSNSRTYAALNVSAQERLKQLETNLVRVRSMLKFNKAPRYVLVNVPAFTLQAVDRGNLALTSNVVVGKPTRATPAVSAQIVEVNFYPTWTVPESIAKADLIPKLQKDPATSSTSISACWQKAARSIRTA